MYRMIDRANELLGEIKKQDAYPSLHKIAKQLQENESELSATCTLMAYLFAMEPAILELVLIQAAKIKRGLYVEATKN